MIRRQVVLPAAPDRVWESLTDPEKVVTWFGGRLDWEPAEGSPLRFAGEDGEEREGRVEAVRPGRHLRFVWWPAGGPEDGASEVSYVLSPVEDGTSLTIQEKRVGPPERAPEPTGMPPAQAQARASSGWTAWDSRIAGAWVGMSAGVPVRARS